MGFHFPRYKIQERIVRASGGQYPAEKWGRKGRKDRFVVGFDSEADDGRYS